MRSSRLESPDVQDRLVPVDHRLWVQGGRVDVLDVFGQVIADGGSFTPPLTRCGLNWTELSLTCVTSRVSKSHTSFTHSPLWASSRCAATWRFGRSGWPLSAMTRWRKGVPALSPARNPSARPGASASATIRLHARND